MAVITEDAGSPTEPDDADDCAPWIAYTPGASALLAAALEALIEEYERDPEQARERVERWRARPDRRIALPMELMPDDLEDDEDR
jgi:hypothetical protein